MYRSLSRGRHQGLWKLATIPESGAEIFGRLPAAGAHPPGQEGS